MKNLESRSLRVQKNVLSVLDQTRLPHDEVWFSCATLQLTLEAIKFLKLRGAPLIGVAAAIFLELQKEKGLPEAELQQIAACLVDARPTAVNLKADVDKVLSGVGASEIFHSDVQMCEAMADFGAALFSKGENILTHCNTGALATVGRGTALGVVTKAQELGKTPFVWVDETRPLLQGGRLTAWELMKAGVSHKIICDNMAAVLMREKKVDKVLVGSDRICRNGDFANKIGTYSLAVLAKHHGVPFYVVAPESTLDLSLSSGEGIPIEFRPDYEVQGFRSSWGELSWSPKESTTYNPAFDVTPAELVTGWILNTGVFDHKGFVQRYGGEQ